jgi:hypothetical protein
MGRGVVVDEQGYPVLRVSVWMAKRYSPAITALLLHWRC